MREHSAFVFLYPVAYLYKIIILLLSTAYILFNRQQSGELALAMPDHEEIEDSCSELFDEENDAGAALLVPRLLE